MKKIIIYSFILYVTLLNSVLAISSNDISKIENNLYGFDYSKDSFQKRVDRLEKTVYGKSSSGDINKRFTKLSADISADVIGLETKPSKDTFMQEEEDAGLAKADDTVKYPIVDEIEQKIFNHTYPERDFHTRIVKIEKKLFGKIYDVEDYASRMDRIKAKVLPETIAKSEPSYDDGSYYNDEMINSLDLAGTSQSRYTMPFGQRKYSRPYSNFGDYSEHIPENSELNNELAQMEYDMFGTEFSNESTQSRIKRLNSVNKAKKTSKKYDSQKFSQHMSTAMEIGAMILMVLAMIL